MHMSKRLMIVAGVALLAASAIGPVNANASVNMRYHPHIVNNSEISGPATHTDYQYDGNYFSTNANGTIISLNGYSHPSDYAIDEALGINSYAVRAHRRYVKRIHRIRKARARQRKARARQRKAYLNRAFINRYNRKIRRYNSLMKKAQKRHNNNRAIYYRGMIDGSGRAIDRTTHHNNTGMHRWMTKHLINNAAYKKGWMKGNMSVPSTIHGHKGVGTVYSRSEYIGVSIAANKIPNSDIKDMKIIAE